MEKEISPQGNHQITPSVWQHVHILKHEFKPLMLKNFSINSESSRQGVGTGHASSNFAASHYLT